MRKIDYRLILIALSFIIVGCLVNLMIDNTILISEESNSTDNGIIDIDIDIGGYGIDIDDDLEDKNVNISVSNSKSGS
ncbi:MAG: hypothetical protein MJ211_15350 [Bacteroidales bacterium]|nr:hypothetical protein [Bacteroidales bacterium]